VGRSLSLVEGLEGSCVQLFHEVLIAGNSSSHTENHERALCAFGDNSDKQNRFEVSSRKRHK
jgi:hypothetical protein